MKLYVEEPGVRIVTDRVAVASGISTCRIAYAEARAAFGRLERLRRLTRAELRAAVVELDRDWSRYHVVDVFESIVRRAGHLAERYALRGYDAVHLSSALALRDAGVDLEMTSFDRDLARAANREGLLVTAV